MTFYKSWVTSLNKKKKKKKKKKDLVCRGVTSPYKNISNINTTNYNIYMDFQLLYDSIPLNITKSLFLTSLSFAYNKIVSATDKYIHIPLTLNILSWIVS